MPFSAIFRVLKILLPIVLGAAIGYFTNDLAIRMLFRPRRAVYLRKWRLPFTPGIIPKNQPRIAKAVGNAVSGQLFTSEDLVSQIKNSAAKKELAERLADALYKPDLTLRSVASLASVPEEDGEDGPEEDPAEIPETGSEGFPFPDATVALEEEPEAEKPEGMPEKIGAYVADRVAGKMAEADLRTAIEDLVWEGVKDYRKNPVVALFLNESAVDGIVDKAENAIRTYVAGDGRAVIRDLVAEEARAISEKPVGELAQTVGITRDRAAEALSRAFDRFAERIGTVFSERTDIGGVVQSKIEEMDPETLETLVMSVMKRELQAVINLGALIGAVIGAVNIWL